MQDINAANRVYNYELMIKLLLFRAHQGDLISGVIEAITRSKYTHAAILKDELTNTISEAWWPHVRERQLNNSELQSIDVFEISKTYPQFTGITPAENEDILSRCREAEKIREDYSIGNLFRFLPGVEDLIGKVQDDGNTSAVFCSQYCADKIGFRLLNAPAGDLAPGYLAWSLMLFPAPPLRFLKPSASS